MQGWADSSILLGKRFGAFFPEKDREKSFFVYVRFLVELFMVDERPAKRRRSAKEVREEAQVPSEPLRFLVQEHHARRLHWDFRLELDGVLKSWAVPKGVPAELGIKRLAVEVEDHPLSYFGWEGTIPKGEYGAGTVKVWDEGLYVLELRGPGKYHVFLQGKKLKGDYRLVNFKDKNWLIYRVA